MNVYSAFVFLHVAIAILGLGPLTTLAVVTTWPSARAMAPFPPERIAQLMRIVGWSMAGVVLTGIIIIALTRGALGHVIWMRVSVGLFVLLGFLHGRARRIVRQAAGAGSGVLSGKALGRIFWGMCAVVASITYLMEAKPW